MLKVSGGCACGAVRYETSDQPTFSFHCQCRQCQQATGGGHSSQFAVSAKNLKVTGDMTFFEQTLDSGSTVGRGFCPICGSPVLGTTSRSPDVRMISAASLDDSSDFSPQKVFFHDEALPWDHVDQALLESE